MVHHTIGHVLDGLAMQLTLVLVLLVWLTLPVIDEQVPADILDTVADFSLGSVTD